MKNEKKAYQSPELELTVYEKDDILKSGEGEPRQVIGLPWDNF